MTSLNLDLDFMDYTPTASQDETQAPATDSAQDRPGVQIRIPELATQQHSPNQKQASSSTSSNLFQNLFNNATGLGSQTGMSDVALRQIIWAANKQRQSQHKPNKTNGNFNWGLNYLSQYFDVTTTEVLERIVWSAIPLRRMGLDIDNLDDTDELMAPLSGESLNPETSDRTSTYPTSNQRPYSYMERFIQSRPDFYGPFWVGATLVFVIAIFSNIASFANYHSKITKLSLATNANPSLNMSADVLIDKIGMELDGWHYSMDEMNMSSSLVMVYTTIIPTLLWFCFWFRGCTRFYTLTETACAYGYSLSIFIPLAVMLTIQNMLFRLFMTTLAAALSGMVLVLSFLPIVKSDPNLASSHIILAIVLLCHFGLAYIVHRIMLQY